MFYTYSTTSGVTHRNGAIKHIFYESDPRRIISRLFFIHFVAPYACFIWQLKYCLNLSVWFDTLIPYIHLSVVFPSRMPAGPHFIYATNTIKWKHSNIWHKSSTKHKESDQIETIKTIMQTTRPRITWKVYSRSSCHFKRNIRSSAKRFRLWIVLFWTKTSQRLTLYLLSSHR